MNLLRHRSRIRHVVRLGLTTLAAACTAHGGARTQATPVQSAAAPQGADTLAGVEWVRVRVPTGGTISAAVGRPEGPGPHPVLIILHGTHGFAREYVTLARDLAKESGMITVAGCWFTGRRGAGVEFVTPIDCPEAPTMPTTGLTPEAVAVVSALVDAARTLPGVRADRVALLGHSRGAVATASYALDRADRTRRATRSLRAIVLNSGAYPPELVARAGQLDVPVLVLHGTADGPTEGGSEMTSVERARTFVAALADAGKRAEVEYFDGAGHSGIFKSADQRARSIRLISAFLRRQAF
jgi:dienelactone hydrolase